MITPGIFKANDIRGVVAPTDATTDATDAAEAEAAGDAEWDAAGARVIGAALVEVLDLAGKSLVVGYDMRVSSPLMSEAFRSGVVSAGADVVDIGLASTDLLWYASGALDLPGAMFTASHNPARYNGLKFCLSGARPVTSDILRAVADRALSGSAPAARAPGRVSTRDLLGEYRDHLLGLVDLTGIRRLTVVADAGNGMAGLTLPGVLGGQDLELIGLYTDLDGTFPNHPPNPLEPENLRDAQRAVTEAGADLGLVFDGDADRCFLIDERGELVSPSAITAMIAEQELAREPGSAIVINKITSHSVAEIVAARGGRTVVTRVGHTFVKAAMAEHDAIFGGEHSGHFYFRDFWGADTGMLAALHVLALVGRSDRPLSQLASVYNRFVASGEINSTVADVEPVLQRLTDAFAGRARLDRMDGLTVSGEDWWVNVRPSNTEPLLRLNVEAPDAAQMAALRDEALALIRG